MAEYYRYPGAQNVGYYIGKDGKRYDTLESARAGDEAYDNAQYTAKVASGMVKQDTAPAGSSAQNNELINNFLSTWSGLNEKVLKSLNDVISGIDTTMAGASEGFQSMIADIKSQAKEFNDTYGGMEKEALAAASQELRARGEFSGMLRDYARPDFAGVTGRAAADVSGASERARQAEAREMMSYGIDPTSGRFGTSMEKSRSAQARNEAIAKNLARTGEKERAAGVAATGLQLINPGVTAGIAQGIQTQRSGFAGLQADLTQADIASRLAALGAKTNVAGAIGDIGRDYGSAGLTMLGLQQSQAPTTSAGVTAPMSTPTAMLPGMITLGGRDQAGNPLPATYKY